MEVKLPEDVAEGFWEEFCPLLNEGGSRRDFIRQEIKIFQQFMADAAAFHAEEEMDQLDKPQPAVTGKILSGFLTNWAVLQAMLSTIAQSVDLTFCGNDI